MASPSNANKENKSSADEDPLKIPQAEAEREPT